MSEITRRDRNQSISFLLDSIGINSRNYDYGKYLNAREVLIHYFSENIPVLLSNLLNPYKRKSIFMVDHVHGHGSEMDYAKAISRAKNWSSFRVMKISQILFENEDMIEKLELPVQKMVNFFLNPSLVETDEKEVNMFRSALRYVLENLGEEVVVVMDKSEVVTVGAETIVKTVAGNSNISFLIFSTGMEAEGAEKEVEKLNLSGSVVSFRDDFFPKPHLKTELLNFAVKMASDLSSKGILGKKRGTEKGIASTISFLIEIDALNKFIESSLKEFRNPYVIAYAMVLYISLFYSKIYRNPEEILKKMRGFNPNLSKKMMTELSKLLNKMKRRVYEEVRREFYSFQ